MSDPKREELRRRLAYRSELENPPTEKPVTNTRRSVPPKGLEDLTEEQLISYLDISTNQTEAGKYWFEFRRRVIGEFHVTGGRMLERTLADARKSKPETSNHSRFPPDNLIRDQHGDYYTEENSTPRPEPISKIIREIEEDIRPYGPLFYEILASSWDFIAPTPPFKPIRYPPWHVKQFLEDHKDDSSNTIKSLTTDQQGYVLKIIKCYQGWLDSEY